MLNLYTSKDIYTPNYYHFNLIEELEKVFSTKAKFLGEDSSPGVFVFFAFARELFNQQTWFSSLRGPKIIIEHDAYLNFMKESEFYKAWTKFHFKTHFNLLISSGKKTTEKLLEDKIPTKWVAKGTNESFLKIPNSYSSQIGCFGVPILERETNHKFHFYQKRHEMAEILKDFSLISSEVKDFADTVSKFSAGVTNDETMEEPMAKHFEMSALGCIPIRDFQQELYDLGYNDDSMITYKNFDEMKDKIKSIKKNNERLVFMQKKTKDIAKNHTWKKRAEEIYQLVKIFRKTI